MNFILILFPMGIALSGALFCVLGVPPFPERKGEPGGCALFPVSRLNPHKNAVGYDGFVDMVLILVDF